MLPQREDVRPVVRTAATDTPTKAWARALALTAPIAQHPTLTLSTRIGQLAEIHGERSALIGEDESLSYRALAERSNRYARWALAEGIGRSDVVCLVMHNCPDYFAAWLGITRVGAIAALINTNLIGSSLAHAIRVASPRSVIVSAELASAVAAIRSTLDPSLSCWVRGASIEGIASIDIALQHQSPAPVTEAESAPPSTRDRALYIYTSGTTGLPKAAVVRHHRLLQWSYWFAGLLDTGERDRMYNCLPMYHSVGGVVALGSVLVHGGSVVLRRKFSARAFWDDIARHECTLFQYIGELCRFLLNSPPHAREREHQIRIACGNGLRADVWESFQTRFAIPRILEFYAATEANFSLYNCEGRPGAIGRIPPFLAHRFPVALAAFDFDSEEPLRDERGFCRPCGVDEVGEALGKIASGPSSSPETQFDGYTDRTSTDRKVLRDVFAPGDVWFRSGDLMRRDAAGFFHFVDRVGDTFRWKGENVATTEVAAAVCAWPGIKDAVAYGVSAPGHDGRAGMVAIVVDGELDLNALLSHLTCRLPEYARPVFVRILREIESTGTFKPKKQDLIRVGFDPHATTDPLFVYDRESDGFVRLDAAAFERINSGQLRL